MSDYASFGSLFFLAFLASFISYTQQQDPTYLYHVCPNTTTYSKNSIYSSNLKSLLTSLSNSNDRFFSTGFQSTVVGQSPDVAYGLFTCRGDISPEVCRDCVVFAAKAVLYQCPDEKKGVIWYDHCRLRYGDQNFFSNSSLQNGTNGIVLFNTKIVPSNEQDRFRDFLLSTMKQAAIKASNSSTMFDARKTKFTSLKSLYLTVQCTPDLHRQACLRCLQQIIDQIPTNRTGGIVLDLTCSLRYELYPFYNESAIITPQLQLDSVPPPRHGKGGKSSVIIIAVVVPVTALFLLFLAVFNFRGKRKRTVYETEPLAEDKDDITTAGSLQFDFKAIEAATDKFSQSNKLGQGGFGEVYKGTFPSGVQVAVKRLSKTSGQGEKEFENEVVVVAKLQHRNLVRLLGYCLEGEEKILVYEFVPNKSLDYFLFDSTMQSKLDWASRYKIIGGIARGILYLHQDSRLTVIHRDLKAGNILLDVDMNPKVADFGMARIIGMDQTEANTRRIVGTYGYMAPEYAMYGHFSMKSDVYSFGVLVLEIISGMKNSSVCDMDDSVSNLVTYTWRLWSNGSPLHLVDPSFRDNYETTKIMRCIHIALLCVQEDAKDRPTVSAVVHMLTTSSVALAIPHQPGFFFRNRDDRACASMDVSALFSVDDATITSVAPR